MTTELRQPPIDAKLDDWVWKQWFQTIWKRVLEFEASNLLATGTPVDNQIAVWDSASTLEGDANFLWNGTNLIVGTTAASALNEKLRVQGAALLNIPTPALPATSGTDTAAGVGLRIWNGGSWGFDFGNFSGLAWLQSNTITSGTPTYGEIVLNPRGGNVGVGYTSTPPQLFSVNGTSYFVDTLMTGGKIGVNISTTAQVKTNLHTYHTTYDWPDSSSTSNDEDAANLRVQGGSVCFDVGTHSTGAMWIQVRNINNFATNYALHLNPNGGPVIVNTTTGRSWGSGYKVVQTGDYTALGEYGTASYLSNNIYWNGSNWIYLGTGATSGGSLMYFSNGNLTWYTVPTGGTAGNTATLSALAMLFLDGSLSLKQASKSGSIFGSAADYTLNVNGTTFTKGLYSLGTGASEIHRNISGSGTITSAQSALQVGLQSTTNGDSMGAGGGPSLLFFGYDSSNPPAKQFVGRIGGIFESGTASNVYGGVVINVRTNNADSNAATVACTWKASKNMVQEGYTQLGGSGAPAIKMKKLTGTTGSSGGSITSIAHGLTGTKILSWTVTVDYVGDGRGMPPKHTYYAGYEYDTYFDTSNVHILLHATNAGNIYTKGIKVLIVYEE